MINNKFQNYNIIYKTAVIVLLTFSMLYNYSNIFVNTDTSLLDKIIVASLLCLYILFKFADNYISKSDIAIVIFLLLIWFIFKRTELLVLILLCCVCLRISPQDVINIYKNIIFYLLIINFLYSIITNNFYNLQGQDISFGFSNQNQTSFFISLLLAIIVFQNRIKQNLKILNLILLMVGIGIDIKVFGDLTAAIFLLLILIFILLPSNIVNSKIIKLLVLILPFALTIITYFLAIDYNPLIDWMAKLNHLLSDRLNIWNYYFSQSHIQLISKNELFVISWGSNYTPHQGAFDSSYAYLLYIFGYLFTSIYIIGLSICNYKLLKSKKYNLLFLLLAIEISGFTENQMFSYVSSFTSIYALLSFHKYWLYNTGDSLNE